MNRQIQNRRFLNLIRNSQVLKLSGDTFAPSRMTITFWANLNNWRESWCHSMIVLQSNIPGIQAGNSLCPDTSFRSTGMFYKQSWFFCFYIQICWQSHWVIKCHAVTPWFFFSSFFKHTEDGWRRFAFLHYNCARRMTQICVFNTRLF